MQTSASNAADESVMQLGQSQMSSQPSANRPPNTLFTRPAPGSVSRSEAGVSIDLSAASNTAAQGEDPMEMTVNGGGSIIVSSARATPRIQPSDAAQWFQDSNKNASTRGNVSFIDGKLASITRDCAVF